MSVESKRARGAGDWRLTAGRLAVSAFVVWHLAATAICVLPHCPLRARSEGLIRYYLMPIGHVQYWGMFAPDPLRDPVSVEVDVLDARGLRASYVFPKAVGYSVLGKVPRFRYPKFATNLIPADEKVMRQCTARYAVRQLSIPAEAYPILVDLMFQVRRTSDPGTLPDPMNGPKPCVVASYKFDHPGDVRP